MKVLFVYGTCLGGAASLLGVEVRVVGVGRGWLLVWALSGNEPPESQQLGE